MGSSEGAIDAIVALRMSGSRNKHAPTCMTTLNKLAVSRQKTLKTKPQKDRASRQNPRLLGCNPLQNKKTQLYDVSQQAAPSNTPHKNNQWETIK
ncbi:hypothetical protein [Pseudomonas sp. S2_E01]